MRVNVRLKALMAMVAALLLASCTREEPANAIKPVEERTVLFLCASGKIYNQDYELVKELPDCVYANEIISDGGDYFVCGTTKKELVGYWKNGKWNTLHVDFLEDVDHWMYGIGKWDYYIYLLDYPNVLKNSGIFPLTDGNRFLPAKQALAVSEGYCYVVGSKQTVESGTNYVPALYTERKGKYEVTLLPMPDGAEMGECTSVYAYDRTHYLIGGRVDGWPVMWIDGELELLPLSEYSYGHVEKDFSVGEVNSVTICNGEVYAAGMERCDGKSSVATVWHNGEIRHLEYDAEKSFMSEVVEIMNYGDDVYVVTMEYNIDSEGNFLTTTVLWRNWTVVRTYPELQLTNFTII